MARYDRIARLDLPERDDVFTGWPVVGDLADRERDPELGKRARLRFLAVRLLHRLIRQGADVHQASLEQQCEAVREELGQLPSRDAERQRLSTFLQCVPGADFADIARAGLELAEGAAGDGHPAAAEEFYRAVVELTAAQELEDLESRARQRLAQLGATA